MSDKETMKALFDACYLQGIEKGLLIEKTSRPEEEIEHQKEAFRNLKNENAALREKLKKANEE